MKNKTIDSAKLIFAVTVVLMHGFLLNTKYNDYLSGFFKNGLFRVAVPFFFIVSGYLFLRTINNGNAKRWFSHIIKMYIIWSVIYFYTLTPILKLQNESALRKIYLIIRGEITGVAHLWYIPALLLSALVCLIVKEKTVRHIKLTVFIIIMLWLTGVVLNWLFILRDNPNIFFYRNGIFFGIPNFFLGFILAKCEDLVHKVKINLKILVIVPLILTALESLFWTHVIKSCGNQFITSSDMLVSSPLLALAIFIVCLKRNDVEIFSGKERNFSMFIYYSHTLFISVSFYIFYNLSVWSGVAMPIEELATIIVIFLEYVIFSKFKDAIKNIV